MTVLTPESAEAPDIDLLEIPDEVKAFQAAHGIAGRFVCTLYIRVGSGAWQFIQQYKNEIPPLPILARENGHGMYKFKFMWKAEQPGGKKVPQIDEFEIDIAEKPWKLIHQKWLSDEQRRVASDTKAEAERLEAEARIESIQSGVIPTARQGGGDGLDALKRAAGTLRDLGVQVGGNGGSGGNIKDTLLAALPFAMQLWQSMQSEKQAQQNMMLQMMENNTKMLIGLMMSKGNGAPEGQQMMNQLFGAGIDMLKQVAQVKELMAPPPESGVLDKVFMVIDRFGPMLLNMARKTAAERQVDPVYNMAKGSPDLKAVAQSRELTAKTVLRLDETYGFQVANEILRPLADVGIVRPPEMAENFRKYPSEGFGVDGTPISKPEASQAGLQPAGAPADLTPAAGPQ